MTIDEFLVSNEVSHEFDRDYVLKVRYNDNIDYIFKTNLPCIVIANKADKLAVTKVDDAVTNLQNILNPLKDITFLPCSSERKIYTDKVWKEIEKHILQIIELAKSCDLKKEEIVEIFE